MRRILVEAAPDVHPA
jgi:hypothetical protein